MPSNPKPGRRQPKKAAASSNAAALDRLRSRIDRLDTRLVALLNERSKLVVEVGKHKRDRGIPIYAPHRESQVLQNVLQSNRGPLSARSMEGIYRELMSGSFALEQPIRVGFLGPPGSFSHDAAVKQFGSSVEFDDLHTIAGVFTEVRRGHVDYGLVPIENSIGGGIVETLDAFRDVRGDLSIYAEVQIAVHHALLANGPPAAIRRIHSKPEVFDQCRNWLATQFPRAELIPAASSSRAVQTVAEESKAAVRARGTPSSAAIGSHLAGQIYGVNRLFPRVEDHPDNVTRFFVLCRHNAKRTGDDKTSIMFTAADKPGALVSVLSVFDRAGVNLTHIDKRPSKRTNWNYSFFIDAQGHREDPRLKGAIRRAGAHCQEFHVLGSYPRSHRIL